MNIRKTLIIITSAIILLLFFLVSSISYNTGLDYGVTNAEKIRSKRAKNAQQHDKQIRSVLVNKVNNVKIKNQISSSGRVVSVNNITISSEVQGRLIGNNTFKKGTEIKEGNIVFSVKDTDLRLLINAKRSNLMSLVSSNLANIKLDFKSEYEKWNNFFNNIELENDLPDFPEMYSSKEKNYIISRSILAEYLSIKSDEEKLKKYTVRAPFDGIITKSYSDVGANVNPGTPVVDFIRKGDMEVELTVSTSEINFIHIGDIVHFNDNGKEYIGKINRKGKFVNTNTQNISVFTSITDNEESLYNGMYLNATIITEGTENVFKLPRRAIFENNKVFIVDSTSKLKIREVNIIAYQGDEVIIDDADNKTLIVSEPLLNMSEGRTVKAIIR
ncbi:MAG: hypothetical protein CMD16_00250 [Flavobacteriales bacterium]|nr:hypothetical protein [Flavobacteriales bacterium]|tara:strand:- start:3235 stop:4395 length:1161 start_codon:yes stop_codon:yes gene_type:complete